MLSGSVTETKNERVVTLNRNPKEPDMMEKLTFGLDVLNSFDIMRFFYLMKFNLVNYLIPPIVMY
jgi:hypothetical protein